MPMGWRYDRRNRLAGSIRKNTGCRVMRFWKIFLVGYSTIGVSPENIVYFDNEEEIIVEAKKMGIRGYVYESPEQVKNILGI